MKLFLLAICLTFFFVGSSLIAVGGLNAIKAQMAEALSYARTPVWVMDGWLSTR